ncbi:cobalamin-dependent protein [Rhodocaloribacter litoris]|uniref:cobalamin-dependent protein n=1 Tax=Rhodocaloribacter litoris TaxID=2558931 RepID=UPI00141FF000|nr:cobalamin-dependent protein [Rhodocaloribacter litoris]QXD15553.1 cobalamin-dependent protein [Rhodocaloribacter litoris]
MSDAQTILSTREAASLLGVHESSIKRWCNEGALSCRTTAGGHRRIPVDALVRFASERRMNLPLLAFGDEAARVGRGLLRAQREGDFTDLYEVAYDALAHGDVERFTRLLTFLRRHDVSPARLFDHLVGPVMRRIGEGYVTGHLSVGEEHRMTGLVRDAILRLDAPAGEGLRKQRNGRKRRVAVVGCLQGEVHELGALMVRHVLAARGWQVIYLGLDVPTEEFAGQQHRHEAQLMCISMMPPRGLPEALAAVRLLDRMYDPKRPCRLALGGPGLPEDRDLRDVAPRFLEARFFSRMEPFDRWIQAIEA